MNVPTAFSLMIFCALSFAADMASGDAGEKNLRIKFMEGEVEVRWRGRGGVLGTRSSRRGICMMCIWRDREGGLLGRVWRRKVSVTSI